MDKIRKFSLPVPNSNSLQAKIMWTVKDAKKFYIRKKKDNVSQLVRSTVAPVFNKVVQEYDLDTISQISIGQNKKHEYTDDAHVIILEHVQQSLDDFGIELISIFFEHNTT